MVLYMVSEKAIMGIMGIMGMAIMAIMGIMAIMAILVFPTLWDRKPYKKY